MNGSLEIEFPSAVEARKALASLKPLDYDERARVEVKAKGNVLAVSVSAPEYTPLRSTITSLLRDLKVIRDSFKIVGEANGRE